MNYLLLCFIFLMSPFVIFSQSYDPKMLFEAMVMQEL